MVNDAPEHAVGKTVLLVTTITSQRSAIVFEDASRLVAAVDSDGNLTLLYSGTSTPREPA